MKFQITLAICISTLLVFGCSRQPEKAKPQQIISVKVFAVKKMPIYETLDYVGNIRGQEEAMVYPKVPGKITQRVKDEGAFVKKVEPIVYIDRDEAGLKFEPAPVESPLAGVVGRVYVDIGQNVTIQTPIALVVDMERVRIDLDIPEKYLPKISLSQEAKIRVDAYPKEEFIGKVTKISPVLNLENRAAPIEIAIENQGHRLKSGMFAKVELVIEGFKNVPVILKESVMGKEPDTYVYAIENNKAVLKKIVLGNRQGSNYEVRQGLKEGELVVIMGQQKLFEGAQVKTEK